MNEQTKQLERASSRLKESICRFYAQAIYNKKIEFRMTDLYKFVSTDTGGKVAPGSPDRVMRQLKSAGVLNYEVISRSQSTYRALGVTL